MKQIITSFFLVLAVLFTGQAQEPEFKVSINVDSVLMGNRFKVTFSLENGQGQHFQAPQFKDFQIVSGPNQSSNFSMINGQVTQSQSYSYYLEPKDIGNYYIDPASIDTEEQTLFTVPLEVIVLPNPDGIIQQPNRREGVFEFFDSRDFQMPELPQQPSKPKKKRKIYRI